MTLLAILLVFGVERFYTPLDGYRQHGWFLRWSRWVDQRRRQGGVAAARTSALLSLVVPLLIVLQFEFWMREGSWITALLFSMLVLAMSLGPRDLGGQVESVLESWGWEDIDGRVLQSEGLLLDERLPQTRPAVVRALTMATLVESNRRIFATLFWFVLLGPAGGLLLRLTLIRTEQERLQQGGALDWLQRLEQMMVQTPGWLLAFTFALVGNFVPTVERLQSLWGGWPGEQLLLQQSGVAALGLGPVQQQDESIEPLEAWLALQLVHRAELAWMVGVALSVMIGVLV